MVQRWKQCTVCVTRYRTVMPQSGVRLPRSPVARNVFVYARGVFLTLSDCQSERGKRLRFHLSVARESLLAAGVRSGGEKAEAQAESAQGE